MIASKTFLRVFVLTCTILLLPTFSMACTVVIAWKGDRVWVGNNEDWYDLDAKYWYEAPGKKESYGAVFFGFKGEGKYAQGGMNEAGLFFDGLYIDKVKLEKETRKGKKASPTHVFKKMLHQAATVDEALEYLDQYFIPFIKHAQMVIADRNGDYAVINVNGVTRRKLAKESYVVISNFPAEEIDPDYEIPGYEEACSILENSDNPGLEEIRQTLDVSHQNGKVKSVYSNVFDLSNQVITNYYLYDYSKPHIIDFTDRLPVPDKAVYFEELFPTRVEEVSTSND
ncbi:linear amide C-N hydrolase [Aureitalea marina]|uniref:Choloylglycine hydrolase/NAAA C-terminal domain-containing protein n=1 Tax=Aureitalea marina TaxID=930804 RepID=A0A2S7KLN3_9FLAO|nr:linear amide C-N hydrolase [Aureitalea marina]PQB03536.1 hypothetical protein BST85_00460 [Aureitalea marina]